MMCLVVFSNRFPVLEDGFTLFLKVKFCFKKQSLFKMCKGGWVDC